MANGIYAGFISSTVVSPMNLQVGLRGLELKTFKVDLGPFSEAASALCYRGLTN